MVQRQGNHVHSTKHSAQEEAEPDRARDYRGSGHRAIGVDGVGTDQPAYRDAEL